MKIEDLVNDLKKLVESRKNKCGEIKYDNCICGTKDLEIVLEALENTKNERDEYKGNFENTYKRFRHLIESKFIAKYDEFDFEKRRLQVRYKRS